MVKDDFRAYEIESWLVPPTRWGSQNPPDPSDVVSGLNLSAKRVTSQRGNSSWIRTALESPITPAPNTHILGSLAAIKILLAVHKK